MPDILDLNRSVFGTTYKKGAVSRRARKAMALPLEIPECAYEMTYDDCEYVNGGGYFKLTINCTLGGLVKGLSTGVVTGFIAGYISAKFTKIGALAGGWAGAIISGAVGAITGAAISSVVNNMVYGTNGPNTVTLIDCWLPWVKIKKNIDLGEELASAIGGFSGGLGGGLAASAAGYAFGLA